jgi:hypothetical protein
VGGVVEGFLAPFGHRKGHLHLVQRLDVKVVALKAEAVFVGQHGFGLDRQQRIVSRGVLFFHVMAVVGGDHADAEFLRPRLQNRVDAGLMVDAVVLNLDVVVFSEQVAVPQHSFPRLGLAPMHQQLLHLTAEAARKGDDALGMLLKQFVVDARLVIIALGIPARAEAAEVLVTLEGAGQQREVKDALFSAHTGLLVAPSAESGHHVGFIAQNRLDAHPHRVVVKVHRAVHVAVVGHGAGGVVGRDFLDPFQEVFELGGSVQQAVLRVLVQVREPGNLGSVRGATRPVRQVNVKLGGQIGRGHGASLGARGRGFSGVGT